MNKLLYSVKLGTEHGQTDLPDAVNRQCDSPNIAYLKQKEIPISTHNHRQLRSRQFKV
jgi:hypothetical protein